MSNLRNIGKEKPVLRVICPSLFTTFWQKLALPVPQCYSHHLLIQKHTLCPASLRMVASCRTLRTLSISKLEHEAEKIKSKA